MVDLDCFERRLVAQFAPKTVGFEYAVYKGQTFVRSGAEGFAILPETRITADRRMTVTSMSKTITAAAVLRAMEVLRTRGTNISIGSKVAPYLPSTWKLGPHVEEMTFWHLLTHKSGLRSGADEDRFASLQQTIANGSTDANWQQYMYQNCNFSMFRIVIATMLHGNAMSESSDVAAAELETAKAYVQFVQNEVLGRVGLGSVSLAPSGPNEAIRYYRFEDPSKFDSGHDYDWYLLRVGAGHWFMSAKEFARFVAGLRSGAIVSAASFQEMTDNNNLLGMGRDDSTTGGPNWNHNGNFPGGMDGDWMILPEDISVAVLANSTGGISRPLEDIIREAWNTACGPAPTTDVPLGAASLGKRIYAFAKGIGDNRIYVNSAADGRPFDGFGNWWTEVQGGGTTDLAPAAASLGRRIYVFAKGIGDNRIYVNSAADGQPFGGWSEVQW